MLFNWYYSLGPLAEAVVSQDYSFDRKGSRRNFCPLPLTVLTPSLLQAPFLNKAGTTIHRTSFFFFFVNLLLKALISSVWCFTTVLHLGLKRMLKKEEVQIGGQGQDVFWAAFTAAVVSFLTLQTEAEVLSPWGLCPSAVRHTSLLAAGGPVDKHEVKCGV